MAKYKKSKTIKFLVFIGCVYLFLFLFVGANFKLAEIHNTRYIGFVATTIYPYLAFLGMMIGYYLRPIALVVCVVLFLIDMKNMKNNKIKTSTEVDEAGLLEKSSNN